MAAELDYLAIRNFTGDIMTFFFNFDELTWPEVAALQRDVPLVLPLGTGYEENKISESLGNPPEIGLLPYFPFGWIGSLIEIPEKVLEKYLSNLVESLRDDGFSRVYIIAPKSVLVGSGDRIIHLTVKSSKSLEFTYSDRQKVIIVPIGHTEQHSLHLPLSVDTISIEAVAQGTANKMPEQAVCLPVMPYGVSMHRSSFAGTMNAGGRAFEDFWFEIIHSLTQRGFDRFYLMSGHGGNSSFLVNIIKYLGDRHRRIFCATAFLYLSGPESIASLEKYRESKIGGMGHACELETSFMLHLRPDLVHMERVIDDIDFITTDSYYMDWMEGGALVANPPWDDDSIYGAYGAGSLGTAQKGKIWLEAAISEKCKHIMEIHEQQNRREERRNSGFGLWGNH
ncbi:MAG: creatininase family protein [Chloroflexota bacterium]